MCIIYNPVGSLTVVKDHLHHHGLEEFQSIKGLIHFQKSYVAAQQQIHIRHTQLIEQEKRTLEVDIVQLEAFLEAERTTLAEKLRGQNNLLKHQLDQLSSSPAGMIQQLIQYFRKSWIKIKIRKSELLFKNRIATELKKSTTSLTQKRKRYQYLVSHFTEAVNQSSRSALQELDNKKRIIDEINPFIHGALGEQKVVNELAHLPDDYILINDFNCSFDPAIYHRQDNSYIKSVQMDHLLVSPAGIFLIETKNWSEDSLNNPNLYSPVAQIRRASFALFKMLSEEISDIIGTHYWGSRKIPVKNLIVFTNQKPNKAFQYVKVLTLNELRQYITYFKPVFSSQETQMIAQYLLGLNGSERSYKSTFRRKANTISLRQLFRALR